jgi:hypothetical protein
VRREIGAGCLGRRCRGRGCGAVEGIPGLRSRSNSYDAACRGHGHGHRTEGKLVARESELLTALRSRAHALGELDELLDHLGRLDSPVLVAPHGVLEQVGEGASLDEVVLGPRFDLVVEQLAKQFDREVLVLHPAHVGEELIREDGDVRVLQAGGREDADHLIGDDGLRNDLPDRMVEVA